MDPTKIDTGTESLIWDGPENDEITLICQVQLTTQMAVIEALGDMVERREAMLKEMHLQVDPIAAFVNSSGGTTLVEMPAIGTIVVSATRRLWQSMLAAEDSPLLSKAVTLLKNDSETLDTVPTE